MNDPAPREQTHNTSRAEHVSFMILPALISNGNKGLRVNVMLDPCSASSYISEEAARVTWTGVESDNRRIRRSRSQDTFTQG